MMRGLHFLKLSFLCFFLFGLWSQDVEANTSIQLQKSAFAQFKTGPSLTFGLLDSQATLYSLRRTTLSEGGLGTKQQALGLFNISESVLIGMGIVFMTILAVTVAIAVKNIIPFWTREYSISWGVAGIVLGALTSIYLIGIPLIVLGVINVYRASEREITQVRLPTPGGVLRRIARTTHQLSFSF